MRKRQCQNPNPKAVSVETAVNSAAQMPNNTSSQKTMGPPGGPAPTCQCPQYLQHPHTLSTASQFCQLHKTLVGPQIGAASYGGAQAQQNMKKPVRDIRTPPNAGPIKMAGGGGVASNAPLKPNGGILVHNANFNSNYGIMPAAVLAYMNNNKQCSLVPNARVAFEMFHSMGKSVDYDPNTVEDFEDSDDDDAEEEDYDQLISCSEWGDVSEISYRPLASLNDDITTETESVMSAALPSRRPGQRLNGHLMPSGGMGMMRGGAGGNAGPGMNRGGVGGYDSSVLTSECETNSMLDTTDDDATTRFSSSTDRNFSSRFMPQPNRHRPRKKRKKPFQRRMGGRASSFSSITDSTMSLNIITVTLSMETTSFLGISIVGQTHKQGDGGIYVGTIMPGGAVAQDGRIEPGDMILQVNEFSFENMSNDDAVKILREVVVRPGPIKLVVAKCWNPNPQSYFTLPKNDPANLRSTAGDPQSWVEQTTRMMNYKNGPGSGGPMSPSLASVTSDGSFSSSLPESAPPPSAAGGPVFPGGAGGPGGPGAGSGGVAPANSCGTPGSGGSGPNGIAGTNGQEFDSNNVRLSSKSDVLSVLRTIQMPNSGLEIKDRMWLKITIPNAFLGHSLVDWLYDHLEGFSVRKDAHKYASKLLKEGYIKHTTGKASFSEQCYYIFNSEHAITSMNNLSYPGDNSNAIAGVNMSSASSKQRDPLEVDEENDILAPLPYTTPWGPAQYLGSYQPRTAGYQGMPGQPQIFSVNELDTFGPMPPQQQIASSCASGPGVVASNAPGINSAALAMTNGGHSSPGSSNSSNRSGVGAAGVPSKSSGRNKTSATSNSLGVVVAAPRNTLADSVSDLDCSASQRLGPSPTSHRGSSEYFVDPM